MAMQTFCPPWLETSPVRANRTTIPCPSRRGQTIATVAAFCAVSMVLPVQDALAEIISEPGFETPALGSGAFDYDPNDPVPGQSAWTFAGAAGIANIPGAFSPLSAPEGSQVTFLQTFGSGAAAEVCQDLFGLDSNVEYFFSAMLAIRTGCISCVGPADVEFRVDGNAALTVAGGDLSGVQFTRFTSVFIPSSSPVHVCVAEPPKAGLNDTTTLVDSVHVGIFHIFIDGFEGP